MKKTKAPSGTPCTSKSNGYTCALTGDHTEHSSKEKRSGQYITWEPVGDGKIKVTFHQGKVATTSIEDDPNEPEDPEADAAAIAAMDAEDADDVVHLGYAGSIAYVPGLDDEPAEQPDPDGDDPLDDEIRSDEERDFARKMREDREAHAREIDKEPSLTDICEKCQQELGAHDGVRCPKPYGYVLLSRGEILCKDGEFHDSDLVGLGGEKAPQVYKTKAAAGASARHQHRVTEILPWHGAPPRKAAPPPPAPVASLDVVKVADDTEAVTTDPATPGFAQDPAPNPGDTRTVDGRSERWVWGPVGGWGWRAYTGKGKGCAGCGRHKVDCLCKEMKAAPSSADWSVLGDKREPRLTDICTKCGSEVGEHDGKKCPRKAKPPKAVAATADAPASTGERRILGMRRHPAAALFPLLEGEELAAFVERMRPGQRDPIVRVTVGGETYILDGSNRGVACEILGLAPKFVDYEGPKDMDSLVAYSIDKNGDGRRHLDPSIRAMIVVESVKLLPRGNPGETGRSAGLTQAEAGKKLGVSERLVRRAAVVQKEGSAKLKDAVMKGKLAVDAAEKVARLPKAEQDKIADEALAKKSGQMKAGRVIALAKQEEKRAIVRKINEQRVAPMPAGPFGVIYGDYPWLYENSDQHEGSRGHMGYPPMALDQEQLAAARDKGLQVSDVTILDHAREAAKRAAKDCVLVLWTTNLYVIEMKRVLEAYGATHRTMYTWPKPRAGVGTWGRGQTEHLIIASIGNPNHTLNELSTLLESYQPHVVGEHSSKPEEVAELLAKHCAGPHLELFARGDRGGTWACWGAEVDKFASEAA